jgi:hypothetical protein
LLPSDETLIIKLADQIHADPELLRLAISSGQINFIGGNSIHGDSVHGDLIHGDSLSVNDINNAQAVAIGKGAQAITINLSNLTSELVEFLQRLKIDQARTSVEIRLNKKFSDFGKIQQEIWLRALATLLEAEAVDIRIISVVEGSVHLTLQMPIYLAKKLEKLIEIQHPSLNRLDIISVKVENEDEIIVFANIIRDTRQIFDSTEAGLSLFRENLRSTQRDMYFGLVTAVIGLIVVLGGAIIVYLGHLQAASIAVVVGVVLEFVSILFFNKSRHTNQQLENYLSRLFDTERYFMIFKIVDQIPKGDLRDKLLEVIVNRLIGVK